MLLSKPDLFDLRAAIFLILDGYNLKSVEEFCGIAKSFWPEEAPILEQLRNKCLNCKDYEQIKSYFENQCDILTPEKSRRFKLIFSSVLGDFLEAVPHLHPDNSLTENDLYFNSYNSHVCDICGDEIEPGEPAFFRTDPCPTIRHRKCSHNVRSSHEYASIEYMVNEIAYHERDKEVNEKLKSEGWTVIRFWGKDIQKDVVFCADKVVAAIK